MSGEKVVGLGEICLILLEMSMDAIEFLKLKGITGRQAVTMAEWMVEWREGEREWIDVNDRLPEIPSENYEVLKNGVVGISIFRGDWKMFQCDLFDDTNKVSHWRK